MSVAYIDKIRMEDIDISEEHALTSLEERVAESEGGDDGATRTKRTDQQEVGE